MDDNMNVPSSSSFTAVNKDQHSPEPLDSFLSYPDSPPTGGGGLAYQQSLEDVGLTADIDRYFRAPSSSLDNSETLKATSEAEVSNETSQSLPYSYPTIIDEARECYADDIPPFRIRDKGQKAKVVQDMITKEEVEMHFRQWSDADGYGYWEYQNPTDDTKHIVKYDSGQYYPWQGVDAELLMDRPVATVVKPIRSSESAATSSSLARSNSVDDYSGRSVSPTLTRDLRKRTTRQERPFEMDKVEHNLAKKGVKASEAELARTVKSKSNKSKRKRVVDVEPSRSAKRHSSSKLSKRSPNPKVVDTTQTTIRTRLNGFTMASLPLLLTESSVNGLLDVATTAWRFKLNGNSIVYGILSFPWLDDHSNIILSRDNNDTAFEMMLDEIRKSPTWVEGRCSVDLELFA